MKVGYFEAMNTPFSVIVTDLEMMDLEEEYSKQPEKPAKQKGMNNGQPN